MGYNHPSQFSNADISCELFVCHIKIDIIFFCMCKSYISIKLEIKVSRAFSVVITNKYMNL